MDTHTVANALRNGWDFMTTDVLSQCRVVVKQMTGADGVPMSTPTLQPSHSNRLLPRMCDFVCILHHATVHLLQVGNQNPKHGQREVLCKPAVG